MDRTFLVTGTSYGLGAAVADAIRARGDAVVSFSRSAPPRSPDLWVRLDLADTDAVADAVDRSAALAGRPLDGVVFNAGLADRTTSQWTVEQIDRHFRVNALGPVAIWDRLSRIEAVSPSCNVVLVGSFLQHGSANQPAYAISKAALWAWMRSFTMSQDADADISMNMIWPGRVDTPGNPVRELPPGDPNRFSPAARVADVILTYLYQPPGGPRGTIVDLGRS